MADSLQHTARMAASDFALELFARIKAAEVSESQEDRNSSVLSDPTVFVIDQSSFHGMPETWMGHPFEEIKELVSTNLLRALRGSPMLLTPFSSMFEDLLPPSDNPKAAAEIDGLDGKQRAAVARTRNREYKARKLEIAFHALRQLVAARDEPITVKDAYVLREWLLVLEEHLRFRNDKGMAAMRADTAESQEFVDIITPEWTQSLRVALDDALSEATKKEGFGKKVEGNLLQLFAELSWAVESVHFPQVFSEPSTVRPGASRGQLVSPTGSRRLLFDQCNHSPSTPRPPPEVQRAAACQPLILRAWSLPSPKSPLSKKLPSKNPSSKNLPPQSPPSRSALPSTRKPMLQPLSKLRGPQAPEQSTTTASQIPMRTAASSGSVAKTELFTFRHTVPSGPGRLPAPRQTLSSRPAGAGHSTKGAAFAETSACTTTPTSAGRGNASFPGSFPALHARSSLPCHAWRSAQGTATAASSACSATPTAGPIVAGATADAAATVPISVMKRATNAVEAEMPFKAVPTKPPAAAVEMWVGTISKGSPKFVQSVLSSARRAFESCGANRCSVSLHEKEIRVSLGERLSALSYGSLVGVRALLPVSGSPLTVCWVRTFPLPPPRSSGADDRSPIVMKIKAACDESVPAIAAVQSQLEAIGGLVEKIEYAGGRSASPFVLASVGLRQRTSRRFDGGLRRRRLELRDGSSGMVTFTIMGRVWRTGASTPLSTIVDQEEDSHGPAETIEQASGEASCMMAGECEPDETWESAAAEVATEPTAQPGPRWGDLMLESFESQGLEEEEEFTILGVRHSSPGVKSSGCSPAWGDSDLSGAETDTVPGQARVWAGASAKGLGSRRGDGSEGASKGGHGKPADVPAAPAGASGGNGGEEDVDQEGGKAGGEGERGKGSDKGDSGGVGGGAAMMAAMANGRWTGICSRSSARSVDDFS